MKGPKQKSLTAFFASKNSSSEGSSPAALQHRQLSNKKRRTSSFGLCPICDRSFPFHILQAHASECNGIREEESAQKKKVDSSFVSPTAEPLPGLFIYENFITEEEEAAIIAALDEESVTLPWKASNFNGPHFGKRWGVHCNLRDRRVGEAENPLPDFVTATLLPKLQQLQPMATIVPNEANAIDYRKDKRHFLKAHVDDRQLSKEPIANLSLAGDCYMTYTNVSPHRNTATTASVKVLLKRRTLQVLTGKARYDFAHSIETDDLLSERRISVTMRESPLTFATAAKLLATTTNVARNVQPTSWWRNTVKKNVLKPTAQPLAGLFIYEDFITEEEEAAILQELDNPESGQAWKLERHSGLHLEKRFGLDHDLWSRNVRAPKHDMPRFYETILKDKLQQLGIATTFQPNEMNSIDYRRGQGHWLKAHVDDRQKHKEAIAVLSLAGDCCMTFQGAGQTQKSVLLKRRSLQVLMGSARYDKTHGIANEDLLSDRRVSVVLRESV